MAASSSLVMVHVRDPRARWSVPASRVVRIVSAIDWGTAASVLDPLAPIGALPVDEDQRHRVIVLRGDGDRELAVIAAGAIQIADVEASDVLAMPPELSGVAAFSAIIATSAAPAATPSSSGSTTTPSATSLSLVIDPRALAAIALTPLAPPVSAPLRALPAVPPGAVSKRNHA